MNKKEYFLALILPPISAYRTSRKITLALNILFCLVSVPLGIIHAVLLVYLKLNDIKFVFSESSENSPPPSPKIVTIKSDGEFSQQVVGEASYQKNLELIAGEKTPESKAIRKIAVIQHEPENRYDRNACAVYIDGKIIGYLPKDFAKRVAKRLHQKGHHDDTWLEVEAIIDGGWRSKDGSSEGHFGVKLDMGNRINF
ncbi:MAG: HIRAN domain-containing protein [Pseudomonadota bacterium]